MVSSADLAALPELARHHQHQPGEAQQQARPIGARATAPPRSDSQTAVSTGCMPTSSATSPEPMPALTAAQTPPR